MIIWRWSNFDLIKEAETWYRWWWWWWEPVWSVRMRLRYLQNWKYERVLILLVDAALDISHLYIHVFTVGFGILYTPFLRQQNLNESCTQSCSKHNTWFFLLLKKGVRERGIGWGLVGWGVNDLFECFWFSV